MKIKALSIALLAVTFGLLYSCKDHCAHNGTCDDPLNIDYPAAYTVNGGDGTLSVVNLNDSKADDEIEMLFNDFILLAENKGYNLNELKKLSVF